MIDFIKDFFSKISEHGFSDNEEEKFQQTRIATCALLLEMATIDGEFNETEKASIIEILRREYELSDEDVDSLIATASERLEESIDLWRFTNLINEHSTLEQKLQIIEMVWRIAYTDGKLDQHEDYLVHKLATLLRLTHHELIQAKLKVILPQ